MPIPVLQDCWNRPICSAPDAHIQVMERTPVSGQKYGSPHAPLLHACRMPAHFCGSHGTPAPHVVGQRCRAGYLVAVCSMLTGISVTLYLSWSLEKWCTSCFCRTANCRAKAAGCSNTVKKRATCSER